MAIIWFAVQTTAIEEIDRVKGQSENGSDSIHGRIERSSKDLDIYTISQWATVTQTAKKNPQMHTIRKMTQEDFLNSKDMSEKFANTNMGTGRQRVRW